MNGRQIIESKKRFSILNTVMDECINSNLKIDIYINIFKPVGSIIEFGIGDAVCHKILSK